MFIVNNNVMYTCKKKCFMIYLKIAGVCLIIEAFMNFFYYMLLYSLLSLFVLYVDCSIV